MRIQPFQTPWLNDAARSAAEDWQGAVLEVLERQARARTLQRVAVVAGGDHGYWREERVYEREDGSFWYEHDTHRAPSGPPRPAAAPLANAVFMLASLGVARSTGGNIVCFWARLGTRRAIASDELSLRIVERLQKG